MPADRTLHGLPLALVTAVALAATALACAARDDGPAAAGARKTAADAPTQAAPAEGTGGLVVTYEEGRTAADREARAFLRKHRVLEDVAAYADARIALPFDVPLKAASCGAADAFWSDESQSLTFCYEFVRELRPLYERIDTAGTPAERAAAVDRDVVGLTHGVLFHELGHGLVSLYDLPVAGREEDAVDQLATLLLADGDERHGAYAVSTVTAWGALRQAPEGGDPGVAAYSHDHALDARRFLDRACWLYGSDPGRYASVVDAEGNPDGVLPRDRAQRCPAEFARVDASWRTLLQPYLRTT